MSQINGSLTAQGNITGSLNGSGGGGGGATALTQLTDVNISNPSNNQALLYNSESAKWVNGSLPSGVNELSELSDVNISNVQNGQVLRYTVSFNRWENVSPDIAFPIWEETEADISMVESVGGIAMVSISGNQTNKVMSLSFNYPLVCPTVINVTYNDSLDMTDFYIGVPYQAVNDMKVLISLRNKRS